MTTANELKPCGCGGKANFETDTGGGTIVICQKCGIATMSALSPGYAIDQWNKAMSGALTTPPPAVAPQGWQPMDSAPREGSRMILFRRSRTLDYGVGRWLSCVRREKKRAGYWDWMPWTEGENRSYQPTHWMPLPTAPEKSK